MSAPDPQAGAAYRALLDRASGVASTPYQSYSGELVAPINAQQQTGIGNINANAGFAQPFIGQAAQYAMNAASPISGGDIQRYSNPFTQQVVNATQAQFNEQNQQQQQQLLGNSISRGSLGGNRTGIAQAELARQQQISQSPVIAGLMSQGYQTGLNTALSQQQAQAQGAYSLGNLGVAGQNAALTGAGAQVGAGSLQQSTQQAQDQARYQQYLQQLAYPFQTTQWLAGLQTGVGSQLGGTSSGTSTAPAPNQAAQWAGLGLAGAGLFLNRGGRVPGFDGGGGVSGVPYAGVSGWVPSLSITPGRLPNAPQMGGQSGVAPSSDPMKMAQQASSLANSLRGGFGFGSTMGSPGVDNPLSVIGGAGDYAVPTFMNRGGFVHAPHYDDGGTVAGFGELDPSPISYWTGTQGPTAGFGPGEAGPRDVPSPLDTAQWPQGPGGVPQEMAPDGTSPLDSAAWPQGPMGAPTAGVGAAAPQGGAPRGIRNNNPGNIEDGSFARSQPGYVGTDGRFAVFASPEAGTQAQSALLGSYGNKGINTLSGIVNRWAPAGDGNDPAAYVSAVSQATGFTPDQPLDMSNPEVRSRLATAMAAVENGGASVPSGGGSQVSGFAPRPDVSRETPKEGGFGLNVLSPAAKSALMAAGFGMMASQSPFLGTAVGQGAMHGLNTYAGVKAAEHKTGIETKRVDLEAKRLADTAERAAKTLAETTRHHQATEDFAKRQRDIAEMQPVKIGQDRNGVEIYGVRDPKTGVIKPIDPATGRVMDAAPPVPTTPADPSAPSAGTTPPMVSADADSELPKTAKLVGYDIGKLTDAAFGNYNPEVLANESPEMQATVKAVAEGRRKMPALGRNNVYNRRISELVQQYNPQWDESTFPRRQRTANEFSVGVAARNLSATKTLAGHLEALYDASNKLDNTGWRMLNAGQQRLAKATPLLGKKYQDAIKDYETKAKAVSDEAAKVFAGTNSALADREEWIKKFSSTDPKNMQMAAIRSVVDLVDSRLNAMADQYNSGMSTRHGAHDLIEPKYKAIFDRMRHVSETGTAPKPAAAQPVPAMAIPPADQRETGKVYDTPKGKAEWTGSGWKMVQP